MFSVRANWLWMASNGMCDAAAATTADDDDVVVGVGVGVGVCIDKGQIKCHGACWRSTIGWPAASNRKENYRLCAIKIKILKFHAFHNVADIQIHLLFSLSSIFRYHQFIFVVFLFLLLFFFCAPQPDDSTVILFLFGRALADIVSTMRCVRIFYQLKTETICAGICLCFRTWHVSAPWKIGEWSASIGMQKEETIDPNGVSCILHNVHMTCHKKTFEDVNDRRRRKIREEKLRKRSSFDRCARTNVCLVDYIDSRTKSLDTLLYIDIASSCCSSHENDLNGSITNPASTNCETKKSNPCQCDSMIGLHSLVSFIINFYRKKIHSNSYGHSSGQLFSLFGF